jgi:membrane-associated PAP2 superfamily phosphatase
MRAPEALEAGTKADSHSALLLGKRAIVRIGLWLLLAALAIFWLGRFTDVDLMLADRVFDQGARGFPWRDAWLTDAFGHGILKLILTAAAVLTVIAAVVDLVRPRASLGFRLRLQIVALSAILVPLVISMLKKASVAHCPWDLERYGGTQPYVRLFEGLPHGAVAGHCLPGGHASTALWLLSLTVFWLPHAPRKALAVAVAAATFGFTVGWGQQLRGAHFLTHTLWSLWIATAIVLVLVAGQQWRVRARQARASAARPRLEPGLLEDAALERS